jgi:hypothetical protein
VIDVCGDRRAADRHRVCDASAPDGAKVSTSAAGSFTFSAVAEDNVGNPSAASVPTLHQGRFQVR